MEEVFRLEKAWKQSDETLANQFVSSKLNTLFTTNSIKQVKQVVKSEILRLLRGECTLDDFVFRKKYRKNYRQLPPVALVASRMNKNEPEHKERLAYVIVDSHEQLLKKRAVSISEIASSKAQIDTLYKAHIRQ